MEKQLSQHPRFLQTVVVPENSFEYISNGEGRLREDHDKNHVCPCILTKLILVHLLLQSKNEPHHSCNKYLYIIVIFPKCNKSVKFRSRKARINDN